MKKIEAKNALFIKLGSKGHWEKDCIEKSNTIKLGFNNPFHSECLEGKWKNVEKYWAKRRKSKGQTAATINQIKSFYESPEDTLWITFYKLKLYWCFAKSKVSILEDGSRIREVKGKWSSQDIDGNQLYKENLSGKFAKVQGFQGTICNVKEFDYLINKLNNVLSSKTKEAESALSNLKDKIKPLVQSLSWKDFEILVELIFSASGWQRISATGKTEKHIDIEAISPVNNKRAFVQVKSQSNFKEFENYKNRFLKMKQYDEMYYVVHTPDYKLENVKKQKNIEVITLNKIADLVINAGLIGWLIKKTS
ncbi:MAG: hypothetical protein FD143_1842 [Ignavibacteria bacterium]|nr:MAG: hypothetical protein FD143_1842 [Ignavibacteria bacterium]KAF0157712.1 MAG: hypothetical protein FD188_2691 [Ignavibacteria bacterium]